MSDFDDRVSAHADAAGSDVIGLLGWIDPVGQWWIAPLGTPAPDPDRPVPPAWAPMQKQDRSQVE